MDDLSLYDLAEYMEYVLNAEYDTDDFDVTEIKVVSKYRRGKTTELVLRCMINKVEAIIDIFYDDFWVGLDWDFATQDLRKLGLLALDKDGKPIGVIERDEYDE